MRSGILLGFLASIFLIISPMQSVSGQEKQAGEPEVTINPASKARIEYIEPTWEFGSIVKGYKYYHNFAFRNVGTDTLSITRVRTICSCTAAPISADHVAPGDTAWIKVSLDSKKLTGRVKKYVNVDSSDPINPYYRIIFSADVDDSTAVLFSDPEAIQMGLIIPGEPSVKTVKIYSRDDFKGKLKVVDMPAGKSLVATFKNNTVSKDKPAELDIAMGSDLTSGIFGSSISIEAEGKPNSRITIPIIGAIGH